MNKRLEQEKMGKEGLLRDEVHSEENKKFLEAIQDQTVRSQVISILKEAGLLL